MEPREFRAFLRGVRISPRKVRLVADMIRGLDCDKALGILQFTPKRGAYYLNKLLRSAMANVTHYNDEHNTDHDLERMHISQLLVDEGPKLKRWRSAPMGRAVPILRRTTRVLLVITERPEPEPVVEDKKKLERRAQRQARKAAAKESSES